MNGVDPQVTAERQKLTREFQLSSQRIKFLEQEVGKHIATTMDLERGLVSTNRRECFE